jgi:hypothetical protein
MHAKAGSAVLSGIAKLRDLQCDLAAAAVAKAALVVRDKRAILDAGLSERAEAADGWQALMSARSFSVEMLRYWSAETMRRDRAVGRAQEELGLAERDVKRCGEDWYAALQRRDLVKRLAQDVRAARSRKREEAGLQENLDRLAYQRSEI